MSGTLHVLHCIASVASDCIALHCTGCGHPSLQHVQCNKDGHNRCNIACCTLHCIALQVLHCIALQAIAAIVAAPSPFLRLRPRPLVEKAPIHRLLRLLLAYPRIASTEMKKASDFNRMAPKTPIFKFKFRNFKKSAMRNN